ncbi:MAG: hypothetical protein WC889_07015 [Myxococcota bacterium]|jgi:hypothetical protein
MESSDEEIYAAQLLRLGKYESAARALQPMADKNYPYALLSLGWIYDSGNLGNRDASLAKFYYEKAANLGIGAGYFELARLLYDEGTFSESRILFAKGAESGNIQCLAWYGAMMANGEGGKEDRENAVVILKAAANKGQLLAKRRLLAIELDTADSIFSRVKIYIKIFILSFVTVYEALKNPYSDRGYR